MAPALAETVDQWLSEEREALLERAASSISHALGTPLQVIHGRAGLIAADTDDDDIRHSARVIETKVAELTQTIQQVLAFARGALGQGEVVRMQEVVGESTERHQEFAQARDVTLVAEPIDDSVCCFAPRDRVRQIIDNCISQGLTDAPANSRIVVTAAASDAPPPAGYPRRKYCETTVSWEGVPFDEKRFALALEPWLAKTPPDDVRTALRLAVSYGLARRLGGWIDAKGSAERTQLSIYLPAGAGDGQP